MGIFKSNDIRGIFPGELTPEISYRIGFYLPEALSCSRILVGRDARVSSDSIFELVSKGIADAGADVVDIGVCDTSAVYFVAVRYGFCGSVMITASHNPPLYNGMKISGKYSVPVGKDNGLGKLQDLIKNKPERTKSSGTVEFLDIKDEYSRHVREFLSVSRNVKVVFDASNGSAGVFLESVFPGSLLDYTVTGGIPDGTFPVHGPNPLEKESRIRIGKVIREKKADLGILFDGDGDRAVFFDERGEFVSPDSITALISDYFYDRAQQPWKMLYDVRSSRSVRDYVKKRGGTPIVCGTGHARIKRLLKEYGGEYAGELSGHYYFRDNYFCDSGFIAAAVVLSIVSGYERKFSKIVDEINPYFFSGEINFNKFDYQKLEKRIREKYQNAVITEIDGIRMDFDSWWFIIRLSGAESVLRLVVEAESKSLMKDKVREVSNLIEENK